MRIGLLGGTFDPPHIGHLIMGERAFETLDLDRVLYVLAADPPHKQGMVRNSVEDRLAMLTRALAGNARFAMSRVDIDRPGPHYSADTVALLQKEYPDGDFYFIMGGDSLRDLPRWHQPERLIAQCRLAVYPRAGLDAPPTLHGDKLPGLAERVVMLDAPVIDVSSTDIVERLAGGRSVRYVVPDAVLAYIQEAQLYRGNP